MAKDLIEELLELDDNTFNVEKTKEIEIKRLSKAVGHPFMVKVRSLTPARYYELNGRNINANGEVDLGKLYNGNLNICSETIVEPNFDSPELKKKFHLNERGLKRDVLAKVFKVDEINDIGSEVMSISGFNFGDDGAQAQSIADKIKNA